MVTLLLNRLPYDERTARHTAAVMNTRNKTGETSLGWVLKYAGSGKLSEEETLKMMRAMVAKGSNVTTKAFKEDVSRALPCLDYFWVQLQTRKLWKFGGILDVSPPPSR